MEDIRCGNLPANYETQQPSTPTNVNPYYKYEIGEIVEVEHEQNRYWLATVTYCFDQLNLLRWIGNYGEFWVDTTIKENVEEDVEIKTFKTTTRLLPTSMRLYPLGFHKQCQAKSEFTLQVPKTFLTRLYSFNSVNDTYNDINTLDDLSDSENAAKLRKDANENCEHEKAKKEKFNKKSNDQTVGAEKIHKHVFINKLDDPDYLELSLTIDNLITDVVAKEQKELKSGMMEGESIQTSNINNLKDTDSNASKKMKLIDGDEKRHILIQENNDYYKQKCSTIIEEAIEKGSYYDLEQKKVFSVGNLKKPVCDYFDLNLLNDNKQMENEYTLNENIKIYFNHKCFTGPSLSKGKICSLPQYVGPGPSRLVIEEIVSKIISVAYVPPRILNDLSSKTFSDLLIKRGLTDTTAIEFKAKYQKRIHREFIPVSLKSNDVALYCECICEHLKCCYNLFGPNLYDGDDCPGHCRALTKSNKFMKRATYYREKARLGEFMNNNSNSNSNSNNNNTENVGKKQVSNNNKSRARYAGRDSSESTTSSLSRSEQVNSRATSSNGGPELNQLDNGSVTPSDKIYDERGFRLLPCTFEEFLAGQPLWEEHFDKNARNGQVEKSSVNPEDNMSMSIENIPDKTQSDLQQPKQIKLDENQDVNMATEENELKLDYNVQNEEPNEQEKNVQNNILKQIKKPPIKWPNDAEFNMLDIQDLRPFDWTVEEVAKHLDWCRLSSFKPYMISEGVDGQALLLLDRAAIKEHFLLQQPKLEYSPEEVGKLCRFVEFVKNHAVFMG